jgi:hypothetical protein
MGDDKLRKAEDVLHLPDTIPEHFKRLVPDVQERMKQLPPEFTPELRAAVFAAALAAEHQLRPRTRGAAPGSTRRSARPWMRG